MLYENKKIKQKIKEGIKTNQRKLELIKFREANAKAIKIEKEKYQELIND